jgi:hypothetical protein
MSLWVVGWGAILVLHASSEGVPCRVLHVMFPFSFAGSGMTTTIRELISGAIFKSAISPKLDLGTT